jgi:hypothetical protein
MRGITQRNGDAIEETPLLRKHNHAGAVSMNIPLRDGEDGHECASKTVGLLMATVVTVMSYLEYQFIMRQNYASHRKIVAVT